MATKKRSTTKKPSTAKKPSAVKKRSTTKRAAPTEERVTYRLHSSEAVYAPCEVSDAVFAYRNSPTDTGASAALSMLVMVYSLPKDIALKLLEGRTPYTVNTVEEQVEFHWPPLAPTLTRNHVLELMPDGGGSSFILAARKQAAEPKKNIVKTIEKFTSYKVTGPTRGNWGFLQAAGGSYDKKAGAVFVRTGGMNEIGNQRFNLEKAMRGGCTFEKL
jgi:hypothetical protein